MRVAVVGTGSAGRRHLANLAQLGVSDLIAVSEYRRVSHLTAGGRDVRVLDSYDQALAEVDAVVIANPTTFHLDYTARAVAAGRHVLCEKPAATSSAGVADLAQQAAAAGVVVAIGCQFRFNPQLEELRARCRSGELGRLIDVDATQGECLEDYHPDEDYRTSYAARSELGGGVLLTQIHQLDALHWMFGPFEEVLAVGGRLGELEIDVEDSVTYLLRSIDGVAVRGHVDFLRRPRRMEMTVVGTQGSAHWDYYAGRLEMIDGSRLGRSSGWEQLLDRNQMFLALTADFLATVEGHHARPRTTLDDAAEVLALVDAIKESVDRKTSVPVLRPES